MTFQASEQGRPPRNSQRAKVTIKKATRLQYIDGRRLGKSSAQNIPTAIKSGFVEYFVSVWKGNGTFWADEYSDEPLIPHSPNSQLMITSQVFKFVSKEIYEKSLPRDASYEPD